MTDLLKRAVEKASTLPDWQQDELAALMLNAISADQQWDSTLATAPSKIERMAEKALEDIRAGRGKPLDPDKL
jgi:hypothetical protein